MSRLCCANTNPGVTFAAVLEPLRSGKYGFEMFDSFPVFVCAPEWFDSLYYGDSGAGSNIFRGASWGNRLAPARGVASWKRIKGTTKDAVGTILAGVAVRLYRTMDNLFLMQTVSAPDGTYEVGVVNETTQCYLVAYRTSSPDVVGATVNTLVGS
jgi:hypothetical protein